MTEIGAVVIDKTGGVIIGEYKDYEIEIDENRKVTVGEKLKGARPTGIVNILTQGEGVEKVELQVIANVEDGEIESIEAMDGAILKENASNTATEKRFEVTKNGEYHFKIRGTNKRIAVVGVKVSGIIELSDLLKEIEKIEHGGVQSVKMSVKTTNGTIAEKSYSLNVITYKGNLELDGINEVNGATLSNNTYCFGSIEDIGTASSVAKNTVVLKVEGNLTVKEGVKVAPIISEYGGPKGFFIYCTGTFVNYGTIENNYGAKADGEDVYLWCNASNCNYEYIPASGATGAAGASTEYNLSYGNGCGHIRNGINGNSGASVTAVSGSGVKRATAGGGSGGAANAQSQNEQSSGNAGGGTSFGGGGGSGGFARNSYGTNATVYHANGTAGSQAAYIDGSYSHFASAAGGGAGCPGGVGKKGKNAISVTNGENSTGGLLVVFAQKLELKNGSLFTAVGGKGGSASAGKNDGADYTASAGGGGSGGGSINIFMNEIYIDNENVSSYFNVSGGAGGIATGLTSIANGGAGGTGTCNLGYITNGSYISYYSNN